MMNLTQIIAEHVVNTHFEDLDAVTVARAKARLADAMGVILAGAAGEGCAEMLQLMRRWGGAPEATVLVHGDRLPVHNAAWINSLMMRSFDFEAVMAEGPDRSEMAAHISGSTVPCALAMAEYTHAGGKELICAQVLGEDLVCRVVHAMGFDVYNNWDNTGVANCLGTTVIAAKLLRLTAEETVRALGVAINMMGGTMQNVFEGALTFKLPISLSARNGILAAECARAGFSTVEDPLGGKRGFFELYCSPGKPADRSVLTKDLGKVFYADRIYKPWPGCRGTHHGIGLALEATGGRPLDPEAIREIRIMASPHTIGFVGLPLDFETAGQSRCAFSIQFTSAAAIVFGDVRPEHFVGELRRSEKLRLALEKLSLVPRTGDDHALRIEIELMDGRMLSAEGTSTKGDIYSDPLSEDELHRKFRSNALFSGTVTLENAERAWEEIGRLETLPSVEPVIALLRA